MNKLRLVNTALLCTFIAISCSKEDDPKQQDPEVNHVGEKWNISSANYNIVEQTFDPVSQSVKIGTKENIGSFYFDGNNGSFEFDIDKIHKEDVFSFTQNGDDLTIVSISQNVGAASLSQYVIALQGTKSSTVTMVVSGQIFRQSNSGQFTMTGTFQLTKE
jgi:hypothetical protein